MDTFNRTLIEATRAGYLVSFETADQAGTPRFTVRVSIPPDRSPTGGRIVVSTSTSDPGHALRTLLADYGFVAT